METTVTKIKRLSYFLETHHRYSDAVIDPVVDKLLDRERQTIIKQRDEIRADLDQFEQRYRIESSEFNEKFMRGEMGDDIDFVDWSGTWRVYQTTLNSLASLEPALS